MQRPTPISAHAYGEDCARKLPTLNASPWPCGGEYELMHGLWGGRTCEEEVEGDEGGGGSGGYEETGECHRGGVHVQCRGDGNSLCYYAVTPPSPRAGCFRRRPPLLLLFSTASFPTCILHVISTDMQPDTRTADQHTAKQGASTATPHTATRLTHADSASLKRVREGSLVSLFQRDISAYSYGRTTGTHPRRVGCSARHKEEPCRLYR